MNETYEPAAAVVKELAARHLTVSSAESCTGGWIAKAITDIPGSSAVFSGGAVTYTNEMKIRLLGVDPAIIERETEVSAACATAMADGARRAFATDLAVSTTGFAGPGGGNGKDPVGTVYLGFSAREGSFAVRASFDGDREAVREAAVRAALCLILNHLSD